MSSGVSGLALLAQQRDNILLAEVAGLLHNWDKCLDMKAASDWRNGSSVDATKIQTWLQRRTVLGARIRSFSELLSQIQVHIDGLTSGAGVDFKTLADTGIHPDEASHNTERLIQWLGHCHKIAHVDKELDYGRFLNQASDRIATAFGDESAGPDNLFETLDQKVSPHLSSLPFVSSSQRGSFYRDARIALENAWGDNRRPTNEVTLWDWGAAVAALYKAIIASHLLSLPGSGLTEVRLLRISLNGVSFLERAATITDLLGRQKALQDALNRVKELLEVTYPLGNEVYRDENGSAFIVPALDGDDTRGSKLLGLVETLLLDAFRQSNLDGELVPALQVSKASKQAEKLNELLQEQPPPVTPFAEAVSCWWRNATTEICTACGLRPQGWGTTDDDYRQKALGRKVCCVCLERRGRRTQGWANGRGVRVDDEKSADWKRTVWLDEVADRNGRLALLVGRFELKDWLNGEMVQTLLVKAAPDFTPKNPSFARLRRVWETTKHFWEEVRDNDLPSAVGADRRRLVITPENRNELADNLGKYHVHDAELGELRTSLVWDSERRVLLTADDLSQVASKLGLPKRRANDPAQGAEYVKSKLANCTLSLYESGGYRQRREQKVDAVLGANAAQLADKAYAPMIPLLTEPATFMALVPADCALEAVKKISARFKREMGKVRNRLPFFLGTVFFDRRQPLFTALDAGRRMIGLALPEEQLTISAPPTTAGNDCELPFSNGLKWPIPVKMGDVTVADKWYPYFHVIPDASGNPPTGRTRQFERAGKHWVHAESLAQNDQVSVYPARFAYLHLDTSARRFQTGKSNYGGWKRPKR